jgi:glycerate 2-kinase
VTLAVSDIPGDDAAAIASGPTIPDPDAGRDLIEFARRLQGRIPEAAFRRLTAPVETPPAPSPADIRLIATPAACLAAAAAAAEAEGLDADLLGADLEGESRDLARAMAAQSLISPPRPRVLLSGGETTVTLAGRKAGRGGRNTEFALALVLALKGAPGIWALAADTDGEDGASGGAAGALIGPDTLKRAELAGLDAQWHLDNHDSGGFFATLGDLLTTGPTCTNVNDFRAILIAPSPLAGRI